MSPGATLPTKLSYTAQPTKPTTMAMAIALSVRVTRSVAIARHVQDLVVEQCREDQTDHDCDEPRPVALAGPLLLGQRLAQFALETAHAQDPHQVRYRQEQQGREYRDRKPIVDPGRHRTSLLAPGALLYPDQPERQMRREGPAAPPPAHSQFRLSVQHQVAARSRSRSISAMSSARDSISVSGTVDI